MDEAVRNFASLWLFGFFVVAGLLTFAAIVDTAIKFRFHYVRVRQARRKADEFSRIGPQPRVIVPFELNQYKTGRPNATNPAKSEKGIKRRA